MNLWIAQARRSTLWLYAPILLVACCVLLVLGWAVVTLWWFPYPTMQWSFKTGYVQRVDRGGSAYQAGVRRGDRVIAVDREYGLSLRSAQHEQSVGGQAIVALLRDNQPWFVAVALTTPSLSIRLVRLEPLLVGFVFWVMGLVGWALRPVHVVPRLFFLISQVIVLTLVALSLGTIHSPLGTTGVMLAVTLLAPMLLHFFSYFPDPLPAAPRRWLLRWAYSIATLFFLMMFIPSTSLALGTRAIVERSWYGFILVALLAAASLMFRPRTGATLQVLRRQRLLIAGVVVSLVPLLIFSFLPELVRGMPLVSYTWTVPFLVFLPFAYVYALHQGELGRIDMLLNRSLVYFMLSMIVLALYVMLFRLVDQLIAPKHWSRPVLNTVVTLGIAVLYGPLWIRMQRYVDRCFYNRWYDYRTVMRAASPKLSQAQNLEQLVAQLLAVAQTMRFQAAVLLWAEGDELVTRGTMGADGNRRLPGHGSLARLLRNGGRYHWRENLAAALHTADQPLSRDEHALLLDARLPIWLGLANRGQLYGVLLLGERQGDTVLDGEDLDILMTLAGQASVAAENVALLEALRTRLTEVETMRDELAEAKQRMAESREAERLHLAQELHDGPVQDLYGVRFGLGTFAQAVLDHAERARLSKVLAAIEHVNRTLRTICGELRPPTLAPFGLEAAIRSHANSFQEAHPALDICLDLMRDGQTLQEHVRLALFRIYQEALNNLDQHAQAQSVIIRFSVDAEQAILEVQDNGCGFNVPDRWFEMVRQGHLGLLGASERVEALDGHLEVVSAPGKGTLVRAVVPITAHHLLVATPA